MALYVLNVEALGRLSGLVTKRFVDVAGTTVDLQPCPVAICRQVPTSRVRDGVRAKQGDDRPQLRRRPA
jgi:hypothetical protein